MRIRTAILAAALSILGGCACDSVPPDAIERCETSAVFAGHVSTDILFVIDDSGSMDGEQLLLKAALSNFITALAASPVANDFQIGVTTTSVEDFAGEQLYPVASPAPDGTPYPDGALVAVDPAIVDPALVPPNVATWGAFLWTGAAGAPDPGFYGTRIHRWDSPSLVTDFQRNVLVGTSGAGREQPFEAMRLALTAQAAPGAENDGFLRPGARLAIILISDEDDCSGAQDAAVTTSQSCRAQKAASPSVLRPVSEYVQFLNGPIAGESRDTVVAVIAGVAPGTLEPSCGNSSICSNTSCGTATDKADRFLELLAGLGPARTRLASICDANFDQALSDFADVILSQTLPLDGTPGDWRLLVATVEKAGTGAIPCVIAPHDAPAADRNAADAIYSPPLLGRPASLTFQNACLLEVGDRIDVRVVCAG